MKTNSLATLNQGCPAGNLGWCLDGLASLGVQLLTKPSFVSTQESLFSLIESSRYSKFAASHLAFFFGGSGNSARLTHSTSSLEQREHLGFLRSHLKCRTRHCSLYGKWSARPSPSKLLDGEEMPTKQVFLRRPSHYSELVMRA